MPDPTFVNWDDKRGLAAVPSCASVGYRGFLRKMPAAAFLALNPIRKRPLHGRIVTAVAAGAPIGRPFVEVVAENGAWRVVSHEGRGRVAAIAAAFGDDFEVEVCVLPLGLRRRDLSDEPLEWALLADRNRERSDA